MDKITSLLEENNRLLKEIHAIMTEISSQEHIANEDNKALAINLVADLLVEIWADKFKNKRT